MAAITCFAVVPGVFVESGPPVTGLKNFGGCEILCKVPTDKSVVNFSQDLLCFGWAETSTECSIGPKFIELVANEGVRKCLYRQFFTLVLGEMARCNARPKVFQNGIHSIDVYCKKLGV